MTIAAREIWNASFVLGYQAATYVRRGGAKSLVRQARATKAHQALMLDIKEKVQGGADRFDLKERYDQGLEFGIFRGEEDRDRRGNLGPCARCRRARNAVISMLNRMCGECIRRGYAAAWATKPFWGSPFPTGRWGQGGQTGSCAWCGDPSRYLVAMKHLCEKCYEDWWQSRAKGVRFW